MTPKQTIQQRVDAQPDDASYEEILRVLAFEWMVDRGLGDARTDQAVSNEEVGKRIRLWQD